MARVIVKGTDLFNFLSLTIAHSLRAPCSIHWMIFGGGHLGDRLGIKSPLIKEPMLNGQPLDVAYSQKGTLKHTNRSENADKQREDWAHLLELPRPWTGQFGLQTFEILEILKFY